MMRGSARCKKLSEIIKLLRKSNCVCLNLTPAIQRIALNYVTFIEHLAFGLVLVFRTLVAHICELPRVTLSLTYLRSGLLRSL